jgi:hypothetical protein
MFDKMRKLRGRCFIVGFRERYTWYNTRRHILTPFEVILDWRICHKTGGKERFLQYYVETALQLPIQRHKLLK